MYVNKIYIKNFLSVDFVDLDVGSRGVVLVKGENRDNTSSSSNGAGKSNIFSEALTWCLFGVTTKGERADQVLREGKGKNCRVSIDLQCQGKDLVVTRYRNHDVHKNSLHLTVDGQAKTRSKVVDTETLLSSILGVDRDTFLYTTVFGQGLKYRFSELTDAGRKKVLEEVAGVEIFEKARRLTREEQVTQRNEEERLIGAFKEAKTNQGELQGMLRLQQSVEKQRDLKQDQERKDDERKLMSLNKEIGGATEKYEELVIDRDGLKEEESSLKIEVHTLQDESNVLNKKHIKSEVTMRRIKSTIRELTDLEGGNCPTCYQEVSKESLQEVLSSLDKDLSEAKVMLLRDAERLEVKRIALEGRVEPLQDIQTSLAAVVLDIRDNSTRGENLYSKAKDLHSKIEASKQESDYAVLLKETEDNIRAAESRISHLTEDLSTTKESGLRLKFWEKAFSDIRSSTIGEVLGYLNERLAHYCDVLTGGEITASIKRSSKGKIDVEVSTRGGSYMSASGGEKDRIDIAIAFALHDLASSSSGFRSNLLILDEPAVFVDDVGIECIMRLVSEKMDRVDTVFLISHNPNFSGYCDNDVTVVMENGVSRLEEQ